MLLIITSSIASYQLAIYKQWILENIYIYKQNYLAMTTLSIEEFYKSNIMSYQHDLHCVMGKFKRFEHYIQEFASNRKGKGLDVGAGPGGYTSKFFTECDALYGCDANPAVVESLPAKYEQKFEYALGKGQSLPYKDGELDFVVCSCVIQHLNSEEELKESLREMTRVLKKGGVLYLMYKAGNHATMLTHFSYYYNQPRSFRVYDPEKINLALQKCGMAIVKEELSVDGHWIPYACSVSEKQ